jgi:protein-disulfide isomerase
VPRLPQEEAGAPALGPADGRRLIAYSNYRCEPCRAVHREIDRLRADDPGVRVVLRDFIPVYDPVASEAARLARCAATLGAFEPMRRVLLDRPPPKFGQRWFEDAALPALAHTLHVDPAAFTGCLASLAVSDAIARDGAHARTLGFTEAPAFLADGIPLSGMQSAASLSRALRSPSPRLTPRAAAG